MVESKPEALYQSQWVVARKLPETEARENTFWELRKAISDEFVASVFQLVIKNENIVVILGKSHPEDLTKVNEILSSGLDVQLDEQVVEDLKEIRLRRLKWETQLRERFNRSFPRRSGFVLVEPPIPPRDLFYYNEIIYDR